MFLCSDDEGEAGEEDEEDDDEGQDDDDDDDADARNGYHDWNEEDFKENGTTANEESPYKSQCPVR